MSDWSNFTSEELERRRLASVEALRIRNREAFDAWYREECDRTYWKEGQCCAGCDHWISDQGLTGECSAAGIVSGVEVMRSMGITFSSYTFAPGFPRTRAKFHCGLFRDGFDWSTLDPEYLARIGASENGELRPPPPHPAHKIES